MNACTLPHLLGLWAELLAMTGPQASTKSSGSSQVDKLRDAASAHANAAGASLLSAVESGTEELRTWLGYLESSAETGVAKDLLVGTRAALVESASCLCLGMVRPALFSMRATIDMSLAWLFFKDHPVEWKVVVNAGEGYKLPSDLLRYLANYVPGFRPRLELLARNGKRTMRDPYGTLSGYVHGQAPHTMPSPGDLASVVGSETVSGEAALVLSDVCAYICEVFSAVFAPNWADLPPMIQVAVSDRLTAEELKALCE